MERAICRRRLGEAVYVVASGEVGLSIACLIHRTPSRYAVYLPNEIISDTYGG